MSFYLPGGYYFNSRYRNALEWIMYLIRYYGFYVVYLICNGQLDTNKIIPILFVFFSFYCLYDVFCYLNDQSAPSINYSETGEVPFHRQVKVRVNSTRFYGSHLLWHVILMIGFFYFASESFLTYLGLLLVLGVVFFSHNNLSNNAFKGLTLFLLYFLKSLIIIIPLLKLSDISILEGYFIASALFNLSYVPKYALRKVGVFSVKFPNLYKSFVFKAIVLKNVFLIPILFYEPFRIPILLSLVFINTLTILEFVIKKRLFVVKKEGL